MAKHNEIGKKGEALAIRYLEERMYKIEETNWINGKGELDIIARNEKNELVFVEVKSSTNTSYADPAAAVDLRKQRMLNKTAVAYMQSIDYEWVIRFDVIGVIFFEDGGAEIKHYKDAFFPKLG